MSIKNRLATVTVDRYPVLAKVAAHVQKVVRKGPEFHLSSRGTDDILDHELWEIIDKDGRSSIHVPFLRRYAMYCGSVKSRIDYMRKRYVFKESELDGALVLDIGAHVGEFAMSVAPFAKKVICFEPDPVALKALKKNVASYPNVEVFNVALSNKDEETTLYIATAKADTSLFEPETYKYKINTSAFRLDAFLAPEISEQFSSVYLKMDAEGFEPEVLDGAVFWLQRLAGASIDVAPERAGQSTYQDVLKRLQAAGLHEVVTTTDGVLVAQK